MKKNKSFRESGRGDSVGFFKILGLTVVIIAVVFLISLTSPFEKRDETTFPSSTETTSAIAPQTTTEAPPQTQSPATTEAPPPQTTPPATETEPPQTTTAPSLVPTNKEMKELIEEKYLPINPHSRVGELRIATKQIVIHYVANAGSSAENNWKYFKNSGVNASSNFIVGLHGEIIQCMPISEVSYHAGKKEVNYNSIGIEVCHPGSDGKFSEATYDSLIKLVSWLCKRYGISRKNVIRHYDVTGKLCPLYYAGEPGSEGYGHWEKFRDDIIFDR